jgi:hypothetical protein
MVAEQTYRNYDLIAGEGSGSSWWTARPGQRLLG